MEIHICTLLFKATHFSSDPGETPSQSSEVADSQHELDKDGKKKRQRRQRTHFTSQQLQVRKDQRGEKMKKRGKTLAAADEWKEPSYIW